MRNSDMIAKEIDKLKLEYKQVRNAELEAISGLKSVVDKLNNGWYVITTNSGCWWCLGGRLANRCNPNEMGSLRNLEKEGIVSQTEHQINLSDFKK